MTIRRTERFKAAYWKLQTQTRTRADKAISLLVADPRHPSLHMKRMRRLRDVWEVRVDLQHRMTLEVHEEYYLLRNVGKHDETLESP